MDRNLRIRMMLEASDRVTRPLRDIAGGSRAATAALKGTRDRLRELERTQGDMTSFRKLKGELRGTEAEMQAAQTRVAALARQIGETTNPSRQLTREFEKAKRAAAGLKTEHEHQGQALQQVRDRLRAAGIGTADLTRHERELRGAIGRTNLELTEQADRLGRADARARRFADARERFGRVQGAATGVAASGAASIGVAMVAAAPIVAASKGAMDLEEGMAGVAKVTGMTGTRLQSMTNDIVTLSTKIPMTATELASIAAAAGAAGVGMDKMGKALPSQARDLVAFTDAAARMGIAFDMTAEDAGGTMAKWRQAFKMTQPEVEGLGDRINALTNKFGGSASAVAGVVTRIGPLGKVAGLAASSAAALASSLISIGVEEEVAATGIKNTLLTLTKGTAATKGQSAALKTLGLDAVKVSKAMQIDSNGTIVDVLERIKSLSKDKQASLLSELFGTESVGAIAPLLTNLEELKRRLGLVGDKSQYAGSMTAEFLSRINTTTGATDLAANAFQAVNLSLGQALLPTIKESAQWFGAMALRIREFAQRNPAAARAAMYFAAVLAGAFGVFGAFAIAVAAIMGPIAIFNAGLVAMGVAGGAASIGLFPIIATIAAVAGAVALLVAAFNHFDQIYAAWFAFWGGIRQGFINAGNWMATTGVGLFANAGKMILQGILHGLDPSVVLSRIKSIGLGAIRMFKNVLGIHSPSRVFAGLGGYMMQGLTMGIDRDASRPVQRIGALSRAVTSAMAVGAVMPIAAQASDLKRMIVPSHARAPGNVSNSRPAGMAGAGAGLGPISITIVAAPTQLPHDIGREVEVALRRLQAREGAERRATYRDDADGADQ